MPALVCVRCPYQSQSNNLTGAIDDNADGNLSAGDFKGPAGIKNISSAMQEFLHEPTSSEGITNAAAAQRDRNRSLVAELARFFRGSIISAHIITIAKVSIPPGVSFTKVVLESLLYWTCRCGRPGCTESLSLPEFGTGRRPIAIGVRDSRVGSPRDRSKVSKDRLDIYNCLSDFRTWNHATGPFFLYFARIFHPHCKAQLGKGQVKEWV